MSKIQKSKLKAAKGKSKRLSRKSIGFRLEQRRSKLNT